MSASGLMSIGVRAMNANYVGLQTTGHNIANAGVEGYSRQQVDLQTALGQFTGAGFFGKGVDVKTVTRVYDQFLTREAMTSRAQSSFDTARLDRLQQLESLFAGGDDGIGQSAGALLNAMVDLASHPQDLASRNVVLGRAGELAARFSTAAAQLDDIQSGVTQELGAMVAQVNEIARQIASVNDRIAIAQGDRPHAERPARPARPPAVRSVVARADHHRGRRRWLGVGVRRRRPAPGAGRPGVAAASGGRSVRRIARRTRHPGRRQRASAVGCIGGRRVDRRPAALPGRRPGARPHDARPARRGDHRQPQHAAVARPRPGRAAGCGRADVLDRRTAGLACPDQCAHRGRCVRIQP